MLVGEMFHCILQFLLFIDIYATDLFQKTSQQVVLIDTKANDLF